MELLKRNIHMDCRKCSASMETSLEKDHNISDVRPDAVRIIMDKGGPGFYKGEASVPDSLCDRSRRRKCSCSGWGGSH